MTALNTYRRWLARVEDDALRAELSALDEVRDAAQIEDRFYRDLAFGTGGLRGVLGAGTNRMNVYVVRRATQGLAAYLKAAGLPLRCAIAYDSRIGSARFARETARVLAANGVTAYLYPRLEPTPALSWAVRYYGCGAGVCVTASHNPAAYNGYKVYGPDGCQITLEAADAVSKHIGAADHFDGVRLCGFADALADGTVRMIGEDCLEAFLDAVERRSVWDGDRSALRVVYTPLNGTGRECVTKILRRIGVTDVTLVPEQAWPDGSFPTCPYPNPEERAALERGAVVLATGNAMELFGRSITGPDGTEHTGLDLFPFRTTVSDTERMQGDCLAVGAATGQVAVGFVNKASQTTDVVRPLFRMEHGPGNSAAAAEDGAWEGSFYGTHLIGPLLMKNPHINAYFTELLCRRAGLPYQPQDCPHEQRAYEVTLHALQERFQQQ